MQIILLERVEKLGNIGDVATVKNGFARNYLLPRKKAVRATKENLVLIEQQKAELEAQNAAKKVDAETLKAKIENMNVGLVRQAGEDGRLFGSVTAKDIVAAIKLKNGCEVSSEAVILNSKFKTLGTYSVELQLHVEVKASINLSISRTEAEFVNPADEDMEVEA